MCDTQAYDGKRTFLQDQALWNLSFWSNPAWADSAAYSLSATAVTQWVVYHRTLTALHKVTVAETIGSVRGVIPNSKLAQYGDYSYDTDYEDLYCNAEDVNIKYEVPKINENGDFPAKESSDTKTKISNQDCDIHLTHGGNKKRSLNEWLEKLKSALDSVKKIANEDQLLDSWTDTLLKISLRFISAAKINENLVKLLNSDIAFIIDYLELRKTPVSKIELQSIPQPQSEGDANLDSKMVDALWMKLSSPKIRKFWKKDTRILPPQKKNGSNNHLFPLMEINFLRRCQQKTLGPSEQNIDISKNMEAELLGSLLCVINETTVQSNIASSVEESMPRHHFPQAHGEWTKLLFPHRAEPNPPPLEKDFVNQRNSGAGFKAQISAPVTKAEQPCSPESGAMPLRFYMSVPPPPLATAMHMPPPVRPPHYAYCHPRNGVIFVPANNATPNPVAQQRQFKVPATPLTRFPSPVFIANPAASPNCSNSAPQRLNAPIQMVATRQCHRMNTQTALYQPHNPKDITEVQKYHIAPEETSFLPGNISQENEVASKSDCIRESADIAAVPNPRSYYMNNPLVQMNNECNLPPIRIHQNVGNAVKSCNSSFQPVIFEKRMLPATPNAYGLKSNSQFQVRDTGIPVNYPRISNRLPTPVFQQHTLFPPTRNHPVLPQIAFKPRFLGEININNIRRMQERLFYQKCKHEASGSSNREAAPKSSIFIENLPLNRKDASIGFEDKVAKWLKTVNKYARTGSFVNLEEIPEHPYHDISSVYNKLGDAVGKGDGSVLEGFRFLNSSSMYKKVHVPFTIHDYADAKPLGSSTNNLRKHNMKQAKRLLLKHLQLLGSSVLKFKKGTDLESKVKLIKSYIAEINSRGNDAAYLKRPIINFKLRKLCTSRNVTKQKTPEKQAALKHKSLFRFRAKCDNRPLPQTGNYFDALKSDSLINDTSNFKVLIRESHEFNAFPSKRMKINNSLSLFFDKAIWTQDEVSTKISNLNYFDAVIDELFFSSSPIEGIDEEALNKYVNSGGTVNGWMHFKIVVKTIMKNIISSLDKTEIKADQNQKV